MTADTARWLAREVADLLDVSNVGLYEFIWLLRTKQRNLAANESRAIAEQALWQLLSDGVGRLILLTWPSDDAVGDVDPETLRLSDWDDPRQGQPYVALARN